MGSVAAIALGAGGVAATVVISIAADIPMSTVMIASVAA